MMKLTIYLAIQKVGTSFTVLNDKYLFTVTKLD